MCDVLQTKLRELERRYEQQQQKHDAISVEMEELKVQAERARQRPLDASPTPATNHIITGRCPKRVAEEDVRSLRCLSHNVLKWQLHLCGWWTPVISSRVVI